VPEGVRQQVEQHALDLLGRAQRVGRLEPALETDVARPRLGLEATQTGLDERQERRRTELGGERARVDPGQLEKVVHERA
jgi:hypothetical protein